MTGACVSTRVKSRKSLKRNNVIGGVMNKRTLLVILLENRRTEAVQVQKILTDYGCIIKTRLGIHDGVLDACSNTGLIILELVGAAGDIKKLSLRLNAIKGVKTKLVRISI